MTITRHYAIYRQGSTCAAMVHPINEMAAAGGHSRS